MKPIKPLLKEFVSEVDHHTQVPMIARLVRPGEGYGLYNAKTNAYAMKNVDADGKPGKEMLVEFYDKRNKPSNDPIRAHFISRYYLSTLLEGKDLDNPMHGLCLDGGIYEYQVDGKSLRDVLRWADNEREQRLLPRDPDPLTFD